MELDELHIADFRPGAKCHGYSVACGHGRICGIAIKLPQATGGEKYRGSGHLLMFALVTDQVNAAHSPVFDPQIGRKFKFAHRNILERFGFGIQSAEDFASSGISMRVQDAVTAVCAFTSESQLGAFAIEFRAPLKQFLDAFRPFFHQYLGGIGVAQAIAGIECVLEMKADLVFVAECGGNTSLR